MLDKPKPNVADTDTFDMAVIGAGSAGFSAAITAAEDGARVALIGVRNHWRYMRQCRMRPVQSNDPSGGNPACRQTG